MQGPLSRVEYDCTMDEIVDTQLRLSGSTQTYRSTRRKSIYVVAAIGAIVVLAITVREAADVPVALFSAAVAAAIAGFLYARIFDSTARKQYLSAVSEQFGGAPSVHCEIELREDAVWTRQHGMELTFPWKQVYRVEDTSDAVELWFRPGLVTARNRAFAGAAERRHFMETARRLAQEHAASTGAGT